MALILALLVLAHGGPTPPWNHPDVQGPCYTIEHDELAGAQQLHWSEDYSNGWAPYLVLNGSTAAPQACNGFLSAYVSAGDVGTDYSVVLRAAPLTPLPAGAVGYVAWSLGWQEPRYTGAGWSMLGPVALWQRIQTPLFVAGDHVGWRDPGHWPDDPALVGLRLFAQGLILWPDEDEPGIVRANLSGTWVLWFR